jgi:hypothetical protein
MIQMCVGVVKTNLKCCGSGGNAELDARKERHSDGRDVWPKVALAFEQHYWQHMSSESSVIAQL